MQEELIEEIVNERQDGEGDLNVENTPEEETQPVEDTQQVEDIQPEVGGETQAPLEQSTENTPRMFTQEELNQIVGDTRIKARNQAMKSYLERYGVDNDNDLDGIFGKGQAYDILNENYNGLNQKYEDLIAENALLKTKIDPARWDDARLIISGKGLPINEETIMQEVATHPEWLSQGANAIQQQPMMEQISDGDLERLSQRPPQVPPQQSTTIRRMGTNIPTQANNQEENKEAIIRNLFGL